MSSPPIAIVWQTRGRSARRAAFACVLGLLFALVLACAHPQRAALARPFGGLELDCLPQDAEVFVNDQYVGTVEGFAGKPIQVPAGLVRLELRREGYFSAYHELSVTPGTQQSLSVSLRRRPL